MAQDVVDTERCMLHEREAAQIRAVVQSMQTDLSDLKDSHGGSKDVLRDVRDRLVTVEVRLDHISENLTKHMDRAQDHVYKYGWPIILVGFTAAITHFLK